MSWEIHCVGTNGDGSTETDLQRLRLLSFTPPEGWAAIMRRLLTMKTVNFASPQMGRGIRYSASTWLGCFIHTVSSSPPILPGCFCWPASQSVWGWSGAGDRCRLGVPGWPASCTPSPAYPAIPASPAHYPGAWSRTTRQNNLQILKIILTFSKYGLVLVYTDEEQ